MSLFGSSKKPAESKVAVAEVKKTGKEVDSIVHALISHAFDGSEGVRQQISFSLHDLGLAHPELVLTDIMVYIQKNAKKMDQGHRYQLLKIMGTVMENGRDKIANEVAQQLVHFATREMVESPDVKAEWQQPASAVLVLLAVPFPNMVIDDLLGVFSPGVLPHYYVIKTLADVAAANGVAFTLRMRDVLARVIPVLGLVKKSPVKWVFATALGRFAEALEHFSTNADADAKAQVSPLLFSGDMNSAFELLFSTWLNGSKEALVRLCVAESVGYLAGALDAPLFETKLAKLIPAYLAMLKKEKFDEVLPIINGLVHVCKTAVKHDSRILEPHLPLILAGLHPMICRPVNFQQPAQLRIHNELLRCFEVLGRDLTDSVLQFVINRFQLKESSTRLGSLLVLRHFVNCMDSVLEDRKPYLVASVNTLVEEPDIAVRKAILQLIVSMSNHDYLKLDGQSLVRFVCKQSAIDVPSDSKQEAKSPKSPVPTGSDGTTLPQLRSAANHILHVMSTKVPATHPVLWPYLLELINDPAFSPAAPVLAGCIGHIAQLKRDQGAADYQLNFEQAVNLPSPHAIMARLMVLCCVPYRRPGQGVAVIQCMGAMGPNIHPAIGEYWDKSVPALLQHLEGHSEDTLNLNKWQDSLLRMFKESVAVVDKATWLHELCNALCAQFKLYPKDAELQRVIHRYLGALLSRLEAKQILNDTIDLMLKQVNHKDDTERQGFAQGMGLCASKHLDLVLPKLTEALGAPAKKASSGGWFGSSSSKASEDASPDFKRSSVTLAYGYVAAYADSSAILSRLDVHILHNLLPVMTNAKTVLLKVNVVKAVDLIGKALHQSRLPEGKKNWVLSHRDKLMEGLTAYLDDKLPTKGHKPSCELRLLSLNAAATLANLEPALPSGVRSGLLSATLPFLTLYTPHAEAKDAVAEDSTQPDGESTSQSMLNSLNNLYSSILHMDPTVKSLTEILGKVEKYLAHDNATIRERACATYLVLLKKFVSKVVHEKMPQEEKSFPDLGRVVSCLVPRCCDSVAAIRQTAAENIQAMLYLNQVLYNPDNPKPAQEIKLLTDIRGRLESVSSSDRSVVVDDLAAVLCAVLSIVECTRLARFLLNASNDPDADAAHGTALLVRAVLVREGHQMGSALTELMSALVTAVKHAQRDNVKAALLSALRALAKVHFDAVLTHLLNINTPLPTEAVECFVALCSAEEAELTLQSIAFIITTLNETPMTTDKPAPLVMTATSVLSALCGVDGLRAVLSGSFYQALLCSLLMRVGTASNVDKGVSTTDALKALRAFLTNQGEDGILGDLDSQDVWAGLEKKNYDDAITTFTKSICQHHPEQRRPLLLFLAKFYSQQSYVGQRIVATTMLAEFVNHSKDDDRLLSELINFLLPRVADKIDKVRKQALRGLGNLVTVWNAEVSQNASAVLSVLTSASEDAEAEVAAEAVASLTRIAKVVDKGVIGPMLVSMCYRIRPTFDRNDVSVRAAAFTLFGELCRFGVAEDARDELVVGNFLDQVHNNIPVFIVHANDEDEKVRKNCLLAFRKVAALIGEEMVELVSSKEPDSDSQAFDDFVLRLAPIMIKLHADRLRGYLDVVVSYFTSRWNVVRANAAILLAHLLRAASAEERRRVNVNVVVQALVKLLSNQTPEVRGKAAKGLALLSEL